MPYLFKFGRPKGAPTGGKKYHWATMPHMQNYKSSGWPLLGIKILDGDVYDNILTVVQSEQYDFVNSLIEGEPYLDYATMESITGIHPNNQSHASGFCLDQYSTGDYDGWDHPVQDGPDWLDDDDSPSETHEKAILKVAKRRYDSSSDVALRLSNSIVRYKGKPVLVTHSSNTLNVRLCKILASGDHEEFAKVDSSDPDLDISSPPLGYSYNPETKTERETIHYIRRLPFRVQKQGLCTDNLGIVSMYRLNDVRIKKAGPIKSYISVARAIEGTKYTVDEARDALIRGSIGRNISRHFALVGPGRKGVAIVTYRGMDIGLYLVHDNTALIQENKQAPFFSEFLSKQMKVDTYDADYTATEHDDC